MLNIDIVDKEIMDLEKKDTTYAVIERLAWLYTVRDHMTCTEKGTNKMDHAGTSEFLRATKGKDQSKVWSIIDNLMDSLKIVQPKAYESVIRKIELID